MAKAKRMYGCTECGATFSKWAGQCPACHEWNTITEVNGKPVHNIPEFFGYLKDAKSGESVIFFVRRGLDAIFIPLKAK